MNYHDVRTVFQILHFLSMRLYRTNYSFDAFQHDKLHSKLTMSSYNKPYCGILCVSSGAYRVLLYNISENVGYNMMHIYLHFKHIDHKLVNFCCSRAGYIVIIYRKLIRHEEKLII